MVDRDLPQLGLPWTHIRFWDQAMGKLVKKNAGARVRRK